MLIPIVITVAIATVLTWAYYKNRFLPALCTIIVAGEITAVLLYDELRFPKFVDYETLQIHTYAQKWEVSAILATLLLVVFYWVDQMFISKNDYRSDRVGNLFFAVLNGTLFFSLIALTVALWWINGEIIRHFLCVVIVGWLFLFADIAAYAGVEKAKTDRRSTTMKFILFADLPVVLSFTLLVTFLLITHPIEHLNMKPWELALVDGKILNTYEYFVPGAIAFQYLASNVIFLVILWSTPPENPLPPPPAWFTRRIATIRGWMPQTRTTPQVGGTP